MMTYDGATCKLWLWLKNKKPLKNLFQRFCSSILSISGPGGSRTPNLLIRSQMLYPLSHGSRREFWIANLNNKSNHPKTAFAPDTKKSIFVPPYPIEMIISTKNLGILLLLLILGSTAFAQETPAVKQKKGRPNIPGTFQVDVGFNLPSEKGGFNTNVFGSSTVNVYYFYDKRLGKSKFSVHPGIGFGLERYKFNNNKTLGYNATMDSVFMVETTLPNIKKTKLITNYIDIPLEVRFSTAPDDPNRSFKVSLGFKFGVLYESFTKQKYSEDGEAKKVKDKQNFNLYPIRYGPYFRIGAGNFSVYASYTISPLFRQGIGPGGAENINNFTVGISLATF